MQVDDLTNCGKTPLERKFAMDFENQAKPEITFESFAKIDLRVATIQKVEEIPKADKLYKLSVLLGTEERVILAGIKQHYTAESLVGKQIIVVANLAPRKLRGEMSHGMLLAASDDQGVLSLITPDKLMTSNSTVG